MHARDRVVKWSGRVAFVVLAAALAQSPAAATVCSVAGYGDLLTDCRSTGGPCNPATQPQVIQIGGPGSRSSNDDQGPQFNDPGLLDDGNPAAAILEFQVGPDTDMDGYPELTLTARNSSCTSALTAVYFNVGAGITNLTDLRYSGASTTWTLGFSLVTGTVSTGFRADGFGRFDAVIYNGTNPTPTGGTPTELLAGESLSWKMDIVPSGNVCNFTTEVSVVPPGNPQNQRNAVGRFQSGPQGGSAFIGPCSPPLFVQLARLDVAASDGRVLVNWDTASEIANEGFNVIRKEIIRGGSGYVNRELIPGQGDSLTGAHYAFEDTTAVNGVAYKYYLEDIDRSGVNTIHGPRVAIANPANPRVRLQSPVYGEEIAAADRLRFQIETAEKGRLTLQISADATFAGGVLDVPAQGRREVRLSTSETRRLTDLAAGNGGYLYWRVRSAQGSADGSDSATFIFKVTSASAE